MQTSDGQVVEPHSISAGLGHQVLALYTLIYMIAIGLLLSVTDQEALDAANKLMKLERLFPHWKRPSLLTLIK